MKRFLVALCGACVVVLVASAAFADTWTLDNVTWRSSKANLRGSVDSSSFHNNGFTTATAIRADTSVGISMVNWKLPTHRLADTAVDSLHLATLFIYPKVGSSVTAGADSFWVTAQVSIDGSNWVTATPTSTYDGTGRILVEASSLNAVGYVYKQAIAIQGGIPGGLSTSTAPTELYLWGWPLLRFIVTPSNDMSGEFEAYIGHYE